jgi:GR25 family glycosyltransferase involved in LPS biosynthesis
VTVYVVNLDRDEARLRTFRETNAQLETFTRFSAVDGRTVDRACLREAGVIAETLTYNNGQLGCALSHLELWRKAQSDGAPVTVLEDDAILAANFPDAHVALLHCLPEDWSIVLWGWNFDRSVWAEIPEGVARSVLSFDQDKLRENIAAFRASRPACAPVRLRHAFGSLAYSVSPGGARKLLELCLPLSRQFIRFEGFGIGIPNNGIDCMMNLAYPKLKAYVCLPPLAVSENRQGMSHTHMPS